MDDFQGLTPGTVGELLRASGALEGHVRVASLTPVQRTASGLVGSVTRIALQYDPPDARGPRSMILKCPSAEFPLSGEVADVEGKFYARGVAEEASIRVPDVYGCDGAGESPSLLLEDLGTEGFIAQIDGCSPEQATIALREIAKLHARWWNAPLPHGWDWIRPPLESPSGRFCRHSIESYEGEWPRVLRPVAEVLQRHFDEIGERVAGPPHTIIHGDFHAGNLCFLGDGVAMVDFQFVAQGSPMLDVARFLATSLRTDVRRVIEPDLLEGYLDCLHGDGVRDYDMERCVADLRPALLWIVASPLALHLHGIAQEGRRWPERFPILERCVAAIEDWESLDTWSHHPSSR